MLVERDRRILRVSIEMFSRDDQVRGEFGQLLSNAGFRMVATPRMYTHSILIDLSGSEAEVFDRLSARARRAIRKTSKFPVEVRPIHNGQLLDRLERLYRESMDRTEGSLDRWDASAAIALSDAAPQISRIVGLFRTDRGGEDSLLAFAWGCDHGDHAHYDAGGSTRDTDLKVPLAHALMWDLVAWARRNGARWFDMGGMPVGSNDDARLAGISEFKFGFNSTVVQVGEEWAYESTRARAMLVRTVSNGMHWLRRVRKSA
jgi:hypothetical protein